MTNNKPIPNSFYRRREVHEYIERITEGLSLIYPHDGQVEMEWSAMLGEETLHYPWRRPFPRRMYAPIVDIAVGPFALHQQHIQEYDILMEQTSTFLDRLLMHHGHNLRFFDNFYNSPTVEQLKIANQNARCLLAIELEKSNPDAKYLIGSAVNAAALGRIGIVVAWENTRLQHLLRIREYLQFLGELKKNVLDITNLLILDKDQLLQAIESA